MRGKASTAGAPAIDVDRILFRAFAIAALPVALIFAGGLDAARSATLVVSLPLPVIGVAMAVSLFRLLREDGARARRISDHSPKRP